MERKKGLYQPIKNVENPGGRDIVGINTPSGAPPDIESPKYTEAKRLDDVMEEYYYESLVGQGTAGTSSGTAPVPTVFF